MTDVERPAIGTLASADEFARWYWLKDELVASCRARGLPASGSKQRLAARIAADLSGHPPEPPPRVASPRAAMPTAFTPATVIGPGWRCTQALRIFFVRHAGKGFRFNEPLRTFIAERAGRTLGEALAAYEASLRQVRPIAEPFEFNRHVRSFFASRPGATREQAIAAWWAVRSRPKDAP